MRYWEACEAQVTADEAIEECRIHEVAAAVRGDDKALVDEATGEVIADADEEGEYYSADILGYLRY
ncbi:hypothetical protein A6U87_09330 [Rhizobium sp. AC44/96]|uniref:hypothetical protein n=1 Tax=unclassified Rhizobium TaxID=2613769 RepID=UPI00080FD154|nr:MULTISPECIES: hypothetical protein [unclassified Rhizobium]MDM9620462.1 hypothetical protein [Rhizobium sp. S96]OCJ09051.1 hypothetical protein A6U87_09330 [Rhizobium sp. AC44/96]